MRISQENIKPIPWYLKPFFWNQKRKYGEYLEPAKVWAVIPRLFIAVASVYGVLERKKSPISPAIRSLVNIRVAQLNWCRFCVDMNSASFIKRAQNSEKIQALKNWQESSLFTQQEKAALHYAEAMTQVNQKVIDDCFNHLKTHFDEHAIIELTALIAFQNMSSKFNAALDIAPQGLCKKPTSEE